MSETPSPPSAAASFAKLEPYAMQSKRLIASQYAGLSASAKRWLPFAGAALVLLVFGQLFAASLLCAGAGFGYWCRTRETATNGDA